jgi:gas vesicle protein
MNNILFISLAAGLLLATGCSKESKTENTKPTTTKKVAEKPKQATEQVTEKAEVAPPKMEIVSEKAAEITQQATEVANTISVKAEDVMADLDQSVEEVKQQVSNFDKDQLLAHADEYQAVILEKKNQLLALGNKLKGLSMTELLGEKGKALKSQLSQYTEQLTALKDRYEIYLNKLKEFGVDLSAYGL